MVFESIILYESLLYMMKGLDSFVFDYFWVDYFIFDSPSHTCRRIHLSLERVKRVVSTHLTHYFVAGYVGLIQPVLLI